MTMIKDGRGKGYLQGVSSDHRAMGSTITELISSERSRKGKLWGLGTGGITPTGSFSLGPVLWMRNDYKDGTHLFVQKIIFGWNGGSTNFNRSLFSLIFYNTPEPSANNTSAPPQIENVALSGANAAVTDDNVTVYKWDGVGTGMTVAAGGFAQIPNRLSQGNLSIPIDGEIILGPGNSMEFRITPDETGEANVSVVYYTAPIGGRDIE